MYNSTMPDKQGEAADFPLMMTETAAIKRFTGEPIDEYGGPDCDRSYIVYGAPEVRVSSTSLADEEWQRKIAESTGLRKLFYRILENF